MENNEMNANVRTLIVCFVLGVFSLIPLRFYEVAQYNATQSRVLGVRQEIVLPQTVEEEKISAPVLEAPYNEMESEEKVDCVSQADISGLAEDISDMDASVEVKAELMKQVTQMKVCK